MSINKLNYRHISVESCGNCRFVLTNFSDDVFADMIYGCSYHVWEYDEDKNEEVEKGKGLFNLAIPKLKDGDDYISIIADKIYTDCICDNHKPKSYEVHGE